MDNKQFDFYHNLICSNVNDAMDCVRKSFDFVNGDDIKPDVSIALFNKSLYHISIAKALYLTYYADLGTNIDDEFFEEYEIYAKEFLCNYEHPHQHDWELKSINELENSYKFFGS